MAHIKNIKQKHRAPLSKWFRRPTKIHHKLLLSLLTLVTIVGLLGIVARVLASSAWVQTDWSGGVGASTTNQYSAGSNIDATSTAGQVGLSSSEKMSNLGFDTDLSNWASGLKPDQISGLKMWLKADALSSTDGTAISTWADSSGKGNSPSQGNGTKQPIYKTNILNGKPVIRFNGSSFYTITLDSTLTVNSYSLFVVHTPQSSNSYGMVMAAGSPDHELLDINYPTNGKMSTYHAGAGTVGGAYSFSVGTTYISSFTSDVGTATPYTDGAAQTSGTPGTSSAQTWGIGDYGNGQGYYYNGDIAEIILYDNSLSTTNRAAVENYLRDKYAIADSSGVAATRDTSTKHSGSASVKLVAGAEAGEYTQSINVGDTNNYNLSAYAYTDGSAVGSSDAQLYYNGSTVSTTYTDAGSGWYKLTATVVGANAARDYGAQVKSGKTVYVDDFSLKEYPTSGTLTSAIFDGGVKNNWGALSYTAATPAGTSISVKFRSGNNADLSDASAWGSCSAVASGNDVTDVTCAPDQTRYAQYQVSFVGDGSATPVFQDISIGYSASDITPPPTNASSVLMYKSNGGDSVSSNDWTNAAGPYFSWTAGADDAGGSGIKGYCLYLGTDNTANLSTTAGLLGTSPLDTAGACQFAIATNHVDLSTAGYIGTALSSSDSPYYLLVKAIDNANNVYTGSVASFQFRYDNTPPTNPAFVTAPSQFVSNKAVSLTWDTSGGSGPSDANSGLAGLQYRIGSNGTWYGDSHSGSQDAADLLVNDGSYTMQSSPDFANLAEGNNIVYFRTWDNAGNYSPAYVTTVVKINTASPSSPQNVTATPSTNTTNSFAFSWLAPASYTGLVGNITYCYTVNASPTSTNCTYTSAGVTSLPAGSYATQPGDNTFYVVAKDEAGNVNYATAASTTFTANTSAPGVPLNIDIADISVKATSNWKLALSWEAPTNVGAGVSSYKVYRSTDNTNFSQVASTAGTSYVDGGLSPQTYYYKIKACDSANNCGVFTNVVHLLPTGKFTSPASLISGPDVSNLSTRKATISWVTDRTSDSKVAIGTKSGTYSSDEIANSDQTVSHTINLTNLTPGTTYYYLAKWTDGDGNTGASSEASFSTLPAPTIGNVRVSNVNVSSATVNFTSTAAVKVVLYYGKTKALGGVSSINTSSTESTYSISLTGLDDGTEYLFKLNAFDADGNEYEDLQTNSFTTPARPRISNLRFQPVADQPTSTQQITWDTNVPATSELSYGPQGQAQQDALDTKLTTSHSMVVQGLIDNTTYTLVAQSRDTASNLASSDRQVFKTALDTRPPNVSSIKVTTSIKGTGSDAGGQIIVSWKTDEPATSQVAYGEGSTSGSYNNSTAEDASLVLDHVVIISNLPTSQIFHLQALSKDASKNQAKSANYSAILGNASDNVLSIVFNALQKVFGL